MPGQELLTLLTPRVHVDSSQERMLAPGAAVVPRKRWRQRLALGLLALGLLAAVAAALAVSHRVPAAGSGRSATGGADPLELVASGGCHSAEPGERCHTDIAYAMKDRNKHPEWYEGLSEDSTFNDFQAFMHRQVLNGGQRRCPKPCGPVSKPTRQPAVTTDKCHTAKPGEACYNHMVYTKQEATRYPKWYPGLSSQSSLLEVQHYLEQENVCPEPCELAEEEEKARNATKNITHGDCRTAMPGDTCYDDILFAKHTFIVKHPKWYPGLTNYSSNAEFQAYLHNQKSVDSEAEKKKCPLPCDKDAVEEAMVRATCKTAEAHDPCWESVVWGATKGIDLHPEWYKGLSKASTFEDFQLRLHNGPKTKCPNQPCPCHTHVLGDKCYDMVRWVMKEGVRKHPKAFEGLTNKSSFEEVQGHLHAKRTTPCLRPCMPKPW